MNIQVRAYGHARTAIGQKELSWSTSDATTVGDVLTELAEEFGFDEDEPVVMIDGRNIKQLDGLGTPIEDQATLSLSLDTIGESDG